MKNVSPQHILLTQQLDPFSHSPIKNHHSKSNRIPLVPETTLKLKNISSKDLEGLTALLGPRRPMTAFYGNVDPSQLQSTQLWHRENKGLRSEDKFKKYIENVRELRQTSEALLQKNSEAMEIMHQRPAEEPDLSEFMEKTYLRAPKKDKAIQFKFTKNAPMQIQAKKFKSMRKALDEINYEKKSGKKIIKYMTNNNVDPTCLAQPKFVPHESKITQNTQTPSQQSDHLSLEKAMQVLANLHTVQSPLTPSLYHRQESFEYKKDQLKQLKENLSILQRSALQRKTLVIDTEKDEPSPLKTPSQFRSQPKSAQSSKYKSKKQGVERRIKAHKPLEDFLKASATDLEVPQKDFLLNSPLSVKLDFSASKLHLDTSHRNSRAGLASAGIFRHTESEPFYSTMTSPLVKYPNSELFTLNSFEDDKKDFLTQRKEKMKKMLQVSPQARHIRVPNEKIATKERYNTPLESNVSPGNAEKILTQSKVLFFKDRYLNNNHNNLRTNESVTSVYFSSAEKTKIRTFNSYKALSQACESSAKLTPALQNALKRNYDLLDENFAKISNQLTEGEIEINEQIKRDIVAEMQNMSSSNTFNVGRKPKRAATSYSKAR